MILFFANNRKSAKYFGKVCSVLPVRCRLHRDQWFAKPDLSALLHPPMEAVDAALEIMERQNRILSGKALPRWKRWLLVSRAVWCFAIDKALIQRVQPQMVVVWNGLMFRRSMFVAAAKSLGVKVCHMENGLLPNTTVCDSLGVNARNSMPREPFFYRECCRDLESESGKEKKVALVVRGAKVAKQSSGKPLPQRFLFVPFQVDTDSQLILFSPWVKTMKEFFALMREARQQCGLPLVFKEHPSSSISYSALHGELDEGEGIFANEYPTQELIEKAEAVVTINSSVGIEALLLGKKVIVLGEAFFSIPGLVLPASNREELCCRLQEVLSWQPDENLRKNFLSYLRHQYLIEGSWREASHAHCEAVSRRLVEFSRG